MRRLAPWLLLSAAAIAILGALAYLLALAFGGDDLIDPVALEGPASRLVVERHEPLPWLVIAACGGLVALAGWAFQMRRADRLAAERARHGDLARDARAEAERAGADLARVRQEAEEERARARREASARSAERELNRELRDRVYELRRAQGSVGDLSDLPAIVLRIACEMLDADRGLLLARPNGDAASALEVAAAEGFESDPDRSAVERRFAGEVLERDTIVREDDLIAIPVYVADEFSGAVVCTSSDGFDEHDEEVLVAIGDQAGAVLHNA